MYSSNLGLKIITTKHNLHLHFDVGTYERNVLNCTVSGKEDFATEVTERSKEHCGCNFESDKLQLLIHDT
jgi:hypothetical protein